MDSSLEHWREWPKVALKFGRREDSDYLAVPRGRVLLRQRNSRGLIYHGNETDQRTLQRIAELYHLVQWESQIDEHYLMGEATDDLFDELAD